MAIILFGVVIGFVLYWNLFRSKPLLISPETTVLTEPRTPDGQRIDYLKWYQSEYLALSQIATDDNGARILVREIGTGDEFRITKYNSFKTEEERKQYEEELAIQKETFYKALGLDPSVAPVCSLPDDELGYNQYLMEKYPGPENEKVREEKASEHMVALLRTNWFKADPDFVQWWLDRNSPALDMAIQCFEKKLFYINREMAYQKGENSPPLTSMIYLPCNLLGTLTRSFKTRAKLNLDKGDISAALRDQIAMYRLYDHIVQKKSFYTHYLIGNIYVHAANQIPIGGCPEKQPSRADWLRKGAESYIGVTGIEEISTVYDNELILSLDLLQRAIKCRQEGKEDSSVIDCFGGLNPFFFKLGFNWDTVFREYVKTFRSYKDLKNFQENPPENLEYCFHRFYDTETSGDPLNPLLSTYKAWTLETRSKFLSHYIMLKNQFSATFYYHLFFRMIRCQRILQLATAFQLYRCDHGTYPPAFTVDKNGKPLHSWRVLILPYLEELEKEQYRRLSSRLKAKPTDWTEFKKIRLDEPWDSEHNRQFHSVIPKYFDLENNDGNGQTRFCVLTGNDMLFRNDGKGVDPVSLYKQDTKRDVFSMILLAECAEPVCWMKPDSNLDVQEVLASIPATESEESEESEYEQPSVDLPGLFYKDEFMHFTCLAFVDGTAIQLRGFRTKNSLPEYITGRKEKRIETRK